MKILPHYFTAIGRYSPALNKIVTTMAEAGKHFETEGEMLTILSDKKQRKLYRDELAKTLHSLSNPTKTHPQTGETWNEIVSRFAKLRNEVVQSEVYQAELTLIKEDFVKRRKELEKAEQAAIEALNERKLGEITNEENVVKDQYRNHSVSRSKRVPKLFDPKKRNAEWRLYTPMELEDVDIKAFIPPHIYKSDLVTAEKSLTLYNQLFYIFRGIENIAWAVNGDRTEDKSQMPYVNEYLSYFYGENPNADFCSICNSVRLHVLPWLLDEATQQEVNISLFLMELNAIAPIQVLIDNDWFDEGTIICR